MWTTHFLLLLTYNMRNIALLRQDNMAPLLDMSRQVKQISRLKHKYSCSLSYSGNFSKISPFCYTRSYELLLNVHVIYINVVLNVRHITYGEFYKIF